MLVENSLFGEIVLSDFDPTNFRIVLNLKLELSVLWLLFQN